MSSGFTAALFCHRVGRAPSAAQVIDSARHLGVHLPSTTAISPGGFLSPSATAAALATLATLGLFAQWLCLDHLPGFEHAEIRSQR